MTPIKSYIGQSLRGRHVHFKCNCIMNIDITGIVSGWEIVDNEVIWSVVTDNGKTIKIGENHPNMNIEILK